ncbi:eukaryotic translation initiation factor 3 domain-containing protein [Auricularia subglabra TFB-10046 SS5]|uniref:Eukaryotic translation initiation factor 3 subunit C n=1 Tax=Auricularia subglabra (strain TFB-10046 / SS5) TaxID=717982 RepID=J0WWU3_AURST|nr:eukaryotic translation initiation factor 3 domain-containing protein [Auricularia subglabra TFB-10046 SS5]
MSRFFRSAGDSDSDSSSSEEEELLSDSGDEAPKPKTAKPMSRFLRTEGSDDSDEDEDEDDETEPSDDDDDEEEKPQAKRSRFMVGGPDDDDSDDEGPRIVKSAKDKRLDEMEATSKAMDNALKINDWVSISNEFDKLTRLVQRETNVAERVPSLFIKTISNLDASVTTALSKEKEAKKKMNANNARAMNQMKQRVKKTIKEYEAEVKKFQEDPEGFEREYQEIAEREAAAARPRRAVRAEDGGDEGQADQDFTTVAKGGKGIVYAPETVFKNLQMVNEARGKKNTDRTEQLRILEQTLEVANTTYKRIRVLLSLISSRFDYNVSASSYLPLELWTSAQKEVDQLIALLHSDTTYVVTEVVNEYDEMIERTPETENGPVSIRGSVISYVDRLDDEFTKSLQHIDPHGTDYVDRLKDEKGLYQTIALAQALFEKLQWKDPLARVIMRRVEHIYAKPDAVTQALEQGIASAAFVPNLTLAGAGSPTALIHALCVFLYQTDDMLLRTRAMLSHIYHYAQQDKFHTARDMLLMSHLQDSIHNADVGTQILYNRAIVQLGLAAFRSGMIREAQAILQEIFTTQRVKELLAQGVHQQRYTTLTPEQEKAERQRQLPFHTHINTELLEAAFLVSCMLVEIPLLASIDSDELKRKAISKPYRRLLDFADRQIFTGPPETTRDHIMQASKALQDGEWEKCRNLIQSIKIWSLMPQEKAVKDMLARRIQEEGLRTYLFTYAPHYTSVSLDMLARTFSLPPRTVTSIVSKMIWNEELAASLEQTAQVVVFHRVELSRAQQLALTLSDKLQTLVDNNEKYLDQKLGGGATWGDRAERGENRGDQAQERSRRGGATRGAGRGRGGGGARFVQGPLRQGPASQRTRGA